MPPKITPKQQRFIDEYLIDLNATRAYKVVYTNCKRDGTASVNASKLLRNAKVEEYLAKRQAEQQKRTEITQDMVLKELASVAFANGTDYAEVKGGIGVLVKETYELTETQRKAVLSIKQSQTGIEVKTYDKLKALELLGKHLGMFSDKTVLDDTVDTSKIFSALEED